MGQAEVVVIGAGAAGLGVAVELQRRGIDDVIVLDRAGAVGSSWRGRYDGLRLNTVRGLSGLPREPIPRSAGTWPSREAFISYLEDVAERKRLDVRLGVEVERIDRGERALDAADLVGAAARPLRGRRDGLRPRAAGAGLARA